MCMYVCLKSKILYKPCFVVAFLGWKFKLSISFKFPSRVILKITQSMNYPLNVIYS